MVERADVFGYETPLQEEEPRMASEAPLPCVGTIQPSSSKVFVSYSHDTPEHRRRVRDLVTRLRSEGIDCRLDRYEANPSKGWQKWMEAQIAWAEYVLVVCTETYCRRFNGEESPGEGPGATWEGMIITEELYERAGDNDKFIPIVFTTDDAAFIPISLRLTTRYRVSDEVEYEKL